MTTIPRGITKVQSTGNYRVRLKRGDRWHLGGYWQDLEDAVAALNKLEASLPVPVRRTPKHSSWKAEQARQRAEAPGADMTGIYPSASGWTCKITRDQTTYYIGHYGTLKEAIQQRDLKSADIAAGDSGPGYKTVKRRKDPAAVECPALL